MNINKHMDQIHALNLAFAETEQRLVSEIAALTQREQELASQLRAIQQQIADEKTEFARSHSEQESALHTQYAEREKAFNQQLQSVQSELQELRQESAQREKEYAIQARNLQHELDTMLRLQVEREQEIAAQLVVLQEQSAQERTELVRAQKEHALFQQNDQRDREKALIEQLQSEQQELQRLRQEWTQREKYHAEETRQARQKLENQLRQQLQREHQVATQLVALEKEKALQAQNYLEQANTLRSRHAEREKVLSYQLLAKQEELRNLQQSQQAREQQVAAQFLALQQKISEETAEQLRIHKAQERDLCEQHSVLERALREELQEKKQELHDLHADRAKRELEIDAQLRDALQKAEHEKAALLFHQQEQVCALKRQHAEQEHLFRQRLQSAQEEIGHLQHDVERHKEEHRAHAIQAAEALEKLATNQAQREQEFDKQLFDMHEKLQCVNEKNAQLLEECNGLQTRLYSEIHSGQQANEHLKKLLAEMQRSLETMHSSFIWRISSPLRKLAVLFRPARDSAYAPMGLNAPITSEAEALAALKAPTPAITQDSIQPNMSILAPVTAKKMPTTASTLPELLSHHDQQFVQCAYRTLLGREPDAEGMDYYLTRLRNGHGKIEIISQLKNSSEGKAQKSTIPNLEKFISQNKRERYPFIGWIFKELNRSQGRNSVEKEIRSISNRIFLMQQEFENNFEKLAHQIALNTNQITVAIQSNAYRQNLTQSSKPNAFVELTHVTNTKPVNGTVQPPLDATSLMLNIKEEISRRNKS